MGRTIIERGQGYEIYCSDTFGSVVPYAPDKRVDGQNHGFRDLRDRPHLVNFIPEVAKSEALAAILREANSSSALMTLGCDHMLISPKCVSSYVAIAFRESWRNRPHSLATLARRLAREVLVTEPLKIRIALSIEPLRNFFGEKDCFELLLKIFAYGATPQQASAAFEHGASACAAALNRLTLSTRRSGGRLGRDIIILDSTEQS
jgi:hypothetical protein